jgi:hypothetical protein
MKGYRRYTSAINEQPEIGELKRPEVHGSYGYLLFDKRWKEKRAIILNRDINRCINCGNDENLEVHHRQYHYIISLKKFKAPWEYSEKMLITLCNTCHQRGHSKFKVPIIYL